MSRARSRKGGSRRVLLVLSALLAGSGVLRLAGNTGVAIAREFEAIASAPNRPDGESPLSCGADADVAAVLVTLRKRSEELDRREEQIAGRMQALRLAETEIEWNLADLVDTEKALAATMAQADGAAESDIGRLTAVYENMRPKEASALFEEMDPSFAAGFLARMSPDSAAAVMAGMDPGAAYTVSAILAGRNTGVPSE
ncbi:MotE family protein [Tropicimonas sp.]|uniref:MotE family protein n=1 Tax=Tropicimonas sp. TaxID=2067044 RepID=UPI003A8C88E5